MDEEKFISAGSADCECESVTQTKCESAMGVLLRYSLRQAHGMVIIVMQSMQGWRNNSTGP